MSKFDEAVKEIQEVQEWDNQRRNEREEHRDKIKQINEPFAHYFGLSWPRNEKINEFNAGMLIAFDANYGRIGLVHIEKHQCIGCKRETVCICIDQSEGEYNPCTICLDCIDLLFQANKTFEFEYGS